MQFVHDGVLYAELNEMLQQELAEDGYAGVEIRRTPMRTEIIIRATRTREVLGEHKRRKSKLVALDDVKAKADDFIYAAIGRGISSIVEDEGANYNCLVLGESGVGKTTIVEELLYKPLKDLGVLTGEFVVKGPIELQKGKLKAALEEAEGGILFIDEAYGLGSSGATTTQLVGLLQSSGGNVMVVAAGYKGKMMEWLGTNEGLAARFPTLFDIFFPSLVRTKPWRYTV